MKSKDIEQIEDISRTKSRLVSRGVVPFGFCHDGEQFEWLWLPSADVKCILALRNAEHVRRSMHDTGIISEESHRSFLQEYSSLQRLDCVLVHRDTGEYVGAVYLTLTQNGFEIGKYIGNVKFLGTGLAFPMSKMFIEFLGSHVREVTRIVAVTKIDNLKNINLNFKLGFKISCEIGDNLWMMVLK